MRWLILSPTARTHLTRILLSAVKNAGLNATWTETYTLEVASGQGSAGNEVTVMVYNKNLLAGIYTVMTRRLICIAIVPRVVCIHCSLKRYTSGVHYPPLFCAITP